MGNDEIKFPIVRLAGRQVYKVLYGDRKWTFKQGVDYKDVHPSFSAHLSTLKDDEGKLLFEVVHDTKIIKVKPEQSIEAVRKNDTLRSAMKKKSVQLKEGKRKTKRRPTKLNAV